jgi:hypothetical protein
VKEEFFVWIEAPEGAAVVVTFVLLVTEWRSSKAGTTRTLRGILLSFKCALTASKMLGELKLSKAPYDGTKSASTDRTRPVLHCDTADGTLYHVVANNSR